MVGTAERLKAFTDLEGGVETAWASTSFGPGRNDFEPVDLVLLDITGWRGMASNLEWDADYLRSLDELVDHWLLGADRRRLLEIAVEQSSAGSEGLDFKDLVMAWLDPARLDRLVSLVGESQDLFPVFPVCYALGKAFTAADIAVEHCGVRRGYSDEELRLVPADDASAFDDRVFPGESGL